MVRSLFPNLYPNEKIVVTPMYKNTYSNLTSKLSSFPEGELVYATDLDKYYKVKNGALVEWLTSSGSGGTQGLTGANGITGPSGAQGLTGFNGLQGITGLSGLTGPAGPSGGGASGIDGLASRNSSSATTISLSNGQTDNISITGFKSYLILKIQTSAAAWVRLYSSTSARTSDSSRLEGNDPLSGSGVLCEVLTSGAETVIISPSTTGFSESSELTIPLAITNKSGATASITVTLTLLKLEA